MRMSKNHGRRRPEDGATGSGREASAQAPDHGSAGFRVLLSAGLLLAVMVGTAFRPVLDNGFVNFDDDKYITENVRVQGPFSHENVRWAFSTTHAGNWHPLTWLSHMADVRLYAMRPAGHHLTNLLLHTANTLLLAFARADGPGLAQFLRGRAFRRASLARRIRRLGGGKEGRAQRPVLDAFHAGLRPLLQGFPARPVLAGGPVVCLRAHGQTHGRDIAFCLVAPGLLAAEAMGLR